MLAHRVRRRFAMLLLVTAGAAWAQVDLVDPDAKPKKTTPQPKPKAAEPAAAPEGDTEGKDDETPDEEEEAPKEEPKKEQPKVAPKKEAPKKAETAARAPVAPIIVTRLNDADLDAAWDRWRVANAA